MHAPVRTEPARPSACAWQQLGGELKDDRMSVMTTQTVSHYRQRIVDYSLKRMSKRA